MIGNNLRKQPGHPYPSKQPGHDNMDSHILKTRTRAWGAMMQSLR